MGLTLLELVFYYSLTKVWIKETESDDSAIALYSLITLILSRVIYELFKFYNR